jgi:predicted RNase H-like HicB family nuclease
MTQGDAMAIKQARQLSYTVIFEPAEEGGYVVIAPAFGGAITQGETLEEARAMAKEALAALVESYLKDAEPVPEDIKLSLEPVKEEISILMQDEAA